MHAQARTYVLWYMHAQMRQKREMPSYFQVRGLFTFGGDSLARARARAPCVRLASCRGLGSIYRKKLRLDALSNSLFWTGSPSSASLSILIENVMRAAACARPTQRSSLANNTGATRCMPQPYTPRGTLLKDSRCSATGTSIQLWRALPIKHPKRLQLYPARW